MSLCREACVACHRAVGHSDGWFDQNWAKGYVWCRAAGADGLYTALRHERSEPPEGCGYVMEHVVSGKAGTEQGAV